MREIEADARRMLDALQVHVWKPEDASDDELDELDEMVILRRYDNLRLLPNRDKVQADLDLARSTWVNATDAVHGPVDLMRMTALLEGGTLSQGQEYLAYRVCSLENDVRTCEKRDALQAARPEGCTCLGVGGWGWAGLRRTGHLVLQQYCPCPDGERRRLIDQSRKNDESDVVYRLAEEAFVESLPLRLRRFTLATFPITTPGQEAVLHALKVRVGLASEGEESGEWQPWLFLWSRPGTGKSGLAVATARASLRQGMHTEAAFVSTIQLLDRLRASFRRGSDEDAGDIMDEYRDVELLVLDDLGSERATDWATERLLALVAWRYDHEKDTYVTSNLAPEDLAQHLDKDGLGGARLVWRLVEMADVISMDGFPNLRDKTPRPVRPIHMVRAADDDGAVA